RSRPAPNRNGANESVLFSRKDLSHRLAQGESALTGPPLWTDSHCVNGTGRFSKGWRQAEERCHRHEKSKEKKRCSVQPISLTGTPLFIGSTKRTSGTSSSAGPKLREERAPARGNRVRPSDR